MTTMMDTQSELDGAVAVARRNYESFVALEQPFVKVDAAYALLEVAISKRASFHLRAERDAAVALLRELLEDGALLTDKHKVRAFLQEAK